MRKNINILIVEDDALTGFSLKELLEISGYKTALAIDGMQALDYFEKLSFDLILLDIGLPKLDGFELLQYIREHNNTTKIIVLSAKSSTRDKVFSLDSGADDYVTKPFDPDELLSRIRCRLHIPTMPESISFKNTHLNIPNAKVFTEQESLTLTSSEVSILRILFEQPNEIIKRTDLLKTIDPKGRNASDRTLDVHISKLRKSLNEIGSDVEICTKRGMGFFIQ